MNTRSNNFMKPFSIIMIIVCALLASNTRAPAGDFDGTKPFICSVVQVIVCPRDGEIEKDTAENVNLPQFFFINVEKRTVSAKGSKGEKRETAIENVRHENGTLILEGVQLGKAWHAVINEQTGKTTLTGATDDTAFVVFAACTQNQGSGL